MFYIKIADKDKDRLIRRNKIYKDRYEELKVKNLTEIARMQKEYDRAKAQQNSTRSKSKTPIKSVTRRKWMIVPKVYLIRYIIDAPLF